MKNIYNLLKPAGDCLFTLPVKHAVYNIYDELAKIPRWNALMSSNCDFFASFINQNNVAEAMSEIFKLTGFRYYNVEIIDKRITYTGLDNILGMQWIKILIQKYSSIFLLLLQGFITAVNPIFANMETMEKTEYLKDYLKIAAELNVYREAENPSESEFGTPYQLAVAYAVK